MDASALVGFAEHHPFACAYLFAWNGDNSVTAIATQPYAFALRALVKNEVARIDIPAVLAVVAEHADLESKPHEASAAIAHSDR
jgi:hypothetical protein